MESVTVTIGRNIGDNPMPLVSWSDFQTEVGQAVEGLGTVVADTEYPGEWQGVKEDAHVWVALAPDDEFPRTEIAAVERTLAGLARRYGQDGIGFALGDSRLLR